MVNQLIRFGRVVRPSLGLHCAGGAQSRLMGLPGVLVIEVTPGGPAEAAGVKGTSRDRFGNMMRGDVIVEVEGSRVRAPITHACTHPLLPSSLAFPRIALTPPPPCPPYPTVPALPTVFNLLNFYPLSLPAYPRADPDGRGPLGGRGVAQRGRGGNPRGATRGRGARAAALPPAGAPGTRGAAALRAEEAPGGAHGGAAAPLSGAGLQRCLLLLRGSRLECAVAAR